MARSTLARHRNLFSRDPEEGGGGGNPGADGGAGEQGAQGGNDQGKGKIFKPITSQEEFDDRLAERIRRVKAQFPNYDQLKADSEELTRLRKETESATEKAVREAAEKAAAEERSKIAPQAVKAEFRAAAKGVLTDAQRDAFLEDADLTKYLTATGEVDVEKVTKKVEALAPEKPEQGKNGGGGNRVPRDMGQGNRSGGGKASVTSAREDYLERRKKQLAR